MPVLLEKKKMYNLTIIRSFNTTAAFTYIESDPHFNFPSEKILTFRNASKMLPFNAAGFRGIVTRTISC